MFKVGDFVRCVDNDLGGRHHLEVGKVYKVVRVNGFNPLYIRLEGVLHDWRQDRFIPWEPQIGDEVVLKKWEGQRLDQGPGFPNVMDRFVGEIATISSIHAWSVRVVGNDWNWDKEWGIEPNYRGRMQGVVPERAIIVHDEWIPKAGDRVIIEANPAADWMRARGFEAMIGEEHILQNENVDKPGWWKLQDVMPRAYIHISGLRLVAEGAARPLEEPVRGFNERVKGMVAEAKKKAQKPVKPKKLNLKAVIAKARKNLQEAKKTHTCCFSLVGVKGTVVHHFNHACHWNLRDGVGGFEEVAALFDNLSRYEERIADQHKAAFKKYVLFLMKRSPIAHAFKTKTYTEAMTRGVSYNVSSCTADEIAVACCSLRFAHEHTGRIDVWDWCLKHKYSENVAYFMMNCYFRHKDTFCLEVNNWHNIIDGEKSFNGLINGIVKGFHDGKDKPRYSKRHEYGVSRLTHKGGKGDSLRTILAAFSKPVANLRWGAPPLKDVDESKMHEICKFIDGKMKEAIAPKEEQAIIA